MRGLVDPVRIAVSGIVFGAFILGAAAQSGTLRIGTVQQTGDLVTVPVALEGDLGTGVSAMDFRLLYDDGVFEPISAQAGTAAVAAGKQIHANVIRDGEYVVLMAGLNRTSIAGGDVASITMRVLGAPEAGTSGLELANTSLSSPDAVGIPSKGSIATVTFKKPGDGEEKPGEGETPDPPEPAPAPPTDGPPGGGGLAPTNPGPGSSALFPAKSSGAAGGQSNPMNTLVEQMNALDRTRSGIPEAGSGSAGDTPPPGERDSPASRPGGDAATLIASLGAVGTPGRPDGTLASGRAPDDSQRDVDPDGSLSASIRSVGIFIPAGIGAAIVVLVMAIRGVMFRGRS